jgi:hypothetical protein
MRVLGIRASTRHLRYCVLELDTGTLTWINRDEEHRWIVPRASTAKPAILSDAYQEVTRLLGKYQPNRVSIKIAETPRGHPDPKRVSVEAAIILAAAHKHLPVSEKRYRDLRTNSSEVGAEALKHVSKTNSHWDNELADALVAALRELGL